MLETENNRNHPFKDFIKDESGIELLRRETEKKEDFDVKSRYLLSILTNLIDNEKANLYQRTPREVYESMSTRHRGNVEAALVTRAYERAERQDQPDGHRPPDPAFHRFPRWDRQEIALEKWARSRGIWHDDIDEYARKQYNEQISNGTEANVYRYDGNNVAKVIDCSIDPQETIDRLLLTDFLLPATSLDLYGIGRGKNEGWLRILVKQPFIKGDRPDDNMITVGAFDSFECENENDNNPDYVTPWYRLGDLHDRNIIRDRNGLDYIIDCNLFLNTPETGGKWIVPEINYSEETILSISHTLDSLIPKHSAPKNLFPVMDSLYPDFSEQMTTNGRYEHPLLLPLKNGIRRIFHFDTDADGRILYIDAEKVSTILESDCRFNRQERDRIAVNGHIVKENKKYTFNVRSGSVDEMEMNKKVLSKNLKGEITKNELKI